MAFGALATLTGCGDEGAERITRVDGSTASEPKSETAWLGPDAETLPEEWLVRRTKKSQGGIDPSETEVARMLLQEANKRFGDEPRMIANRAAQLEIMLAEKGQREDAMALIETLMRVAPGNSPTGGFASVCQFYFNLRMQGLDREQALNALAKRYGPGAG